MIDGEGGGQGQGGQGGESGQGGGGGGGAEWLAALPAELQADATLGRYKSVEDLARGHIEAHKVAKSKLSIPTSDAPADAWNAVFDQLGRPADPKDYDIPLPEGMKESGLADSFRPIAHQLGLLPGQAKGVVEFYNKLNGDLMAENVAQVDSLKQELGDAYKPQLELAKSAVEKMGLGDEFLASLENAVGGAELIKGFMTIGKLIGEHARADGDGGGLGESLANAEAQIAELQKDKSWRDKLNAGDVTVKGQYERLKQAAIKQATGG